MVTYYSFEIQQEMRRELSSTLSALDNLIFHVANDQFNNEGSNKFAKHGVGRRIRLVYHSLRNIFAVIPTNSSELIPDENLINASINLQSFLSNLYGILDNIAWVWYYENPELHTIFERHKQQIGLTRKHSQFRKHLPKPFLNTLKQNDNWISFIKEIRDALAHQIPLYIIPAMVDEKNKDIYYELDNQKLSCIISRDFDTFDKIEKQQRSMSYFHPYWIKETKGETTPMVLHPQAISDAKTIIVILKEFLKTFQGRS